MGMKRFDEHNEGSADPGNVTVRSEAEILNAVARLRTGHRGVRAELLTEIDSVLDELESGATAQAQERLRWKQRACTTLSLGGERKARLRAGGFNVSAVVGEAMRRVCARHGVVGLPDLQPIPRRQARPWVEDPGPLQQALTTIRAHAV